MEQLCATGQRLLAVADDERKLLGVVTDGDIRRFILAQGSLDEAVETIASRNPTVVAPGLSRHEVYSTITNRSLTAVPEVDEENRILRIYLWSDLAPENSNLPAPPLEDAAVAIMAGGAGTRLAPFTHVLPKPLLPIGDRTMLEHIIERFRAHEVNTFHLIVRVKEPVLRAYVQALGDLPYEVVFHSEAEPSGTAGGLRLLDPDAMPSQVVVSNCDILVTADYADLLAFHRARGHALTVVAATRRLQIPYGVLRLSDRGELAALDEKPSVDFLVNTGVYVLDRETLARIPKDGSYHMTDLIADLMASDQTVGVYPVTESAWADVGQWPEFLRTHHGLVGQ